MNYYNEHDPKAAAWLRELIAQNLIPNGEVDERSIEDVAPSELANFTQCHFFAGIGGWSLALRMAGWPDDQPIWSGSCPCQPFSQAGQGKGISDERHLWPAFKWLIQQRQPPVVIGEQVASKDGRVWLAGVRADLEDLGYAVGAADLCAASVGAPHIRQRLYWVADNGSWRQEVASVNNCRSPETHGIGETGQFGGCCAHDGMAHSNGINGQPAEQRLIEHGLSAGSGNHHGATGVEELAKDGGMGNAECEQYERRGRAGDVGCSTDQEQSEAQQRQRGRDADSGSGADDNGPADLQGTEHTEHRPVSGGQQGRPSNSSGLVLTDRDGREQGSAPAEVARHRDSAITAGFWSDYHLVHCRDGKTRRIAPEPALFPLVDGLSYMLARRRSIIAPLTRGPGNAIVPELAAEFIKAYCEAVTT